MRLGSAFHAGDMDRSPEANCEARLLCGTAAAALRAPANGVCNGGTLAGVENALIRAGSGCHIPGGMSA